MKQSFQVIWRRTQRRLGWTGLGGAALLLAGVAIAAALPGLQAGIQTLEQRLARAQAQAGALPNTPTAAAPDPQQALAALSARLPNLVDNAADLEKIFALAQAHKLELDKGDYQLGADARAPLQTYSVTLPVHASYAVLKKFSAEVLRALPHAALDELRLERHDAASLDTDGRLRFTLIYRGD